MRVEVIKQNLLQQFRLSPPLNPGTRRIEYRGVFATYDGAKNDTGPGEAKPEAHV
jgi:hypothetical protein